MLVVLLVIGWSLASHWELLYGHGLPCHDRPPSTTLSFASRRTMSALGVQVLADLYECDPAALDDEERVREGMLEAARRSGATIVAHCFHRFSPHGMSGVVVIAESHLAIHTWPEHGYAALDLFTCGQGLDHEACFAHLREVLGCKRHTSASVPRGDHGPPGPAIVAS